MKFRVRYDGKTKVYFAERTCFFGLFWTSVAHWIELFGGDTYPARYETKEVAERVIEVYKLEQARDKSDKVWYL